jgi:hypothetical protein
MIVNALFRAALFAPPPPAGDKMSDIEIRKTLK